MSHTDDLIAAAEHNARHFEGDPNGLTIALNAFYAGAHWQEKRDGPYAIACREAFDGIATGGNHLANVLISLLGPDFQDHLPPTKPPAEVLEMFGTTIAYDVWCCWAAIMNARAALAKNPNPSGNTTSAATPDNDGHSLREREESMDGAGSPGGAGSDGQRTVSRHQCTNCRGRGWVNEPLPDGQGVADVPCPKCSAPHSSFNVTKGETP